jgi:hypothetical protein
MKLAMMESYCNRGIKDKMELFFGEGSRIELIKAFPLSQSKSQQITAKVYLTDAETSMNYWPQNISWLVEEAYEFVNGKNDGPKIVVQASYNII